MNIKKTAKKIVAVSAGMGLAGATLMSALAVAPDLADYPNDFIVDGEFDGKIVVGARAASQDIIGAIDIASSLQAASTSDVAVGDSTTTVGLEGDVKKIAESGDQLEIGEQIGSVVETLTDDDLAMLQSGRVTTEKGSTDYTQILELNGASSGSSLVKLDENHDDEVGTFLFFDDGSEFFNYELEFTSGLESDLSATSGTATADDLEDETIFMLGQYYSIVQATVNQGNDDITLELIAGDVSDTLEEGQTKTYTFDGVDYEVTILVVGSAPNVKFLVNGEVTDTLSDGETDTLSDGTEIGVRDIIQSDRSFEGDQGSIVEFYLGANKITFTDNDYTATGSGSVEIDRENIEDATLDITATEPSTSEIRINKIEYSLAVDSAEKTDIYVAAGEGIRQHLDEAEGMLNTNWDIHFAGMSEPTMYGISFDAVGDDEYELSFENRRGDSFSVPYAFTSSGGATEWGDEDDELLFYEVSTDGTAAPNKSADYHVNLDDYFVLTDIGSNSLADNADDTYVLQYTDIDTDDGTVSFEHAGSGSEITATYTGNISDAQAGAGGNLTVGGKNFDFWVYNTGSAYNLAVDMNNNGNLTNNQIVDIVTRAGGILTPSNQTDPDASNWKATLTTLGEDLDNNVQQVVDVVFYEPTSGELDVSSVTTGAGDWYQKTDSDADIQYTLGRYGTSIQKTDDDSDADSVTISYPSSQVEALVYVVGGDVESTTSTSGSSAQRVNVLPVGIAVLDNEVSVDDDNLIVVGGPCANDIAAELLGNPSECTEGFTDGMGMIQSFDTGDNFAVLVAGSSARDTVETSRVLARAATEDVPAFEGDSVQVVIAGENDISVRAPVEAEEEEEMSDDMDSESAQ